MIILGINAFSFNPSACIVRGGKLASFCQEERLNRLKGSYGLFPSKAIIWCLTHQKLHLHDIDYIAFSWGCHKYPAKMFFSLVRAYTGQLGRKRNKFKSSINVNGSKWAVLEIFQLYIPNQIKRRIRDFLRCDGHKGPIPKIEFVEHHLSHAYQTYYQSPFKEAIILVADGSGEENCVSGYKVREDKFEKILSFNIPQSLGWYYGGFTAYLGFNANRDEGKLMALAALGESRKQDNPWIGRFEKIIKVSSEGFEIDPNFFKFGGNEYHPRYTDHLVKYITSFNDDLIPISVNECVEYKSNRIHKYLLNEYIDLAYAVQHHLEKALLCLVKRLIRETGVKKLCLAGGIAMNCKANSRIADEGILDDIFIHPASPDEGACIGAAFFISSQNGEDPRNVLKNTQIGPSYTNDDIEKTLKAFKLSYLTPEDICQAAISLLRDRKILGWFHGGLEMGARALGGRSIIARPDIEGIKQKLDSEVKLREIWRPYAPSVISEKSSEFFDNSFDTSFMILARKANKKMISIAPATVHVDRTTRPQSVSGEILPRWHYLLGLAGKEFGAPILLNTSFNVKGEPIVCSPTDAIRCFFSTGMDALILEDFLLQKTG
jgi:carbamoyltransferase